MVFDLLAQKALQIFTVQPVHIFRMQIHRHHRAHSQTFQTCFPEAEQWSHVLDIV